MQKFFSRILLTLGSVFLFLASYLLYQRNISNHLTFKERPSVIKAKGTVAPRAIEIPSINAHLSIIPSQIHGTKWETTTSGVSYLETTPIPGEKGNSVIYGHNWKTLLGGLTQVKPGQKIYITMYDGVKKEFKVEYTATVDPSQTYIIDNTKDTRITLYTCTGFLDSKRFVVVAFPTS